MILRSCMFTLSLSNYVIGCLDLLLVIGSNIHQKPSPFDIVLLSVNFRRFKDVPTILGHCNYSGYRYPWD